MLPLKTKKTHSFDSNSFGDEMTSYPRLDIYAQSVVQIMYANFKTNLVYFTIRICSWNLSQRLYIFELSTKPQKDQVNPCGL